MIVLQSHQTAFVEHKQIYAHLSFVTWQHFNSQRSLLCTTSANNINSANGAILNNQFFFLSVKLVLKDPDKKCAMSLVCSLKTSLENISISMHSEEDLKTETKRVKF
jgi:hypothetical protein